MISAMPEHHDHASQFAAVLVEVLLVFDVDAHAFAAYDTVGARRPRLRVNDQRRDVRSCHPYVHILIGPSAPERSPGFQMRIAQA